MTARNSLPTSAEDGLSLLDTRQDLAALVVNDATGRPRPGVLTPVGTPLVTPTSTMAYQVVGFRAATSRQAGGAEFIVNDGSHTTDAVAAPTANSRIEIIYARARFSAFGDPSDVPEIAVARGTAALTPTPPPLPDGALELARATIPSRVTSTASQGVVITTTAQFTAGAGGTVPFPTKAVLDTWTTPQAQQQASVFGDQNAALNTIYTWSGTTWVPRPEAPAFVDRGTTPGDVIVSAANMWQDVPGISITKATGHGEVQVTWETTAKNVSGKTEYYEILYRVVRDGSTDAHAVGPLSVFSTPGVTNLNPKYSARASFRDAVTAGSHTWKLQHRCGAQTVVATSFASLSITVL